tara:strand:+ start:581 stop:784 length:204 start_codon:yes stop_codon:yes gene_type:complete
MKPGYKTTEFWLATVATVCGILYASGVISPDGSGAVEKAVAFIAAALASLGYSQARGATKAAGPKDQ